uniref:Uncharacterized protein n=1 Tax=Musa acuminata subsp. malaccensis TaxID=214687 RepID=A0A804IBF2_MUSAM
MPQALQGACSWIPDLYSTKNRWKW